MLGLILVCKLAVVLNFRVWMGKVELHLLCFLLGFFMVQKRPYIDFILLLADPVTVKTSPPQGLGGWLAGGTLLCVAVARYNRTICITLITVKYLPTDQS